MKPTTSDYYGWLGAVKNQLQLGSLTRDDLAAALNLVPPLSEFVTPAEVVKFFEDDFEWFVSARKATDKLRDGDWGQYTVIPFLMVYCVVNHRRLLEDSQYFFQDELDIVFSACGYART